ncbi:MAG: DUF2630 family protein [Ilumatobacteraceae bacterium]|jgi:hypothetical protein
MDEDLFERIKELVAEEHRLESGGTPGEPLGDDDHRRLRDLEVRLDQCWDLLRQRRARRLAGLDPDDAQLRSGDTVEHYRQ